MEFFLDFYRHLPEKIDPNIFTFGSFSLKWYGIAYLVGFLAVYFLWRYRLEKDQEFFSSKWEMVFWQEKIFDFLTYSIFGLLLGGRLGYVLFYDSGYFFQNPWEIFLPMRFESLLSGGWTYTGISGMSYFGGLAGVLVAGWFFALKHKLDFWRLADFIVPAVPAGYFFGRLGNFLNGELFGRPTDSILGMFFPFDVSGELRHPSQIYEAFFEGLFLFILLWITRNYSWKSGFVGWRLYAYIAGYTLARFFLEFFREPDNQIGFIFGGLTLGQLLAAGTFFINIVAFLSHLYLFSFVQKEK